MTRKIVRTNLLLLFIAALVFFLGFAHLFNDELGPWTGKLPKDPHKAALIIMQQAPVIVRTLFVFGSHQTNGMKGRTHW
jgi:membrane dipeptidase